LGDVGGEFQGGAIDVVTADEVAPPGRRRCRRYWGNERTPGPRVEMDRIHDDGYLVGG